MIYLLIIVIVGLLMYIIGYNMLKSDQENGRPFKKDAEMKRCEKCKTHRVLNDMVQNNDKYYCKECSQ